MEQTGRQEVGARPIDQGPGDKHDEILLAAAQCFSRKGFDACSLDDIARIVGLHKASLYHYVNSKQDILYQCLERSFGDIGPAEEYLRDESVPVMDRIRVFFRALGKAQSSPYGRSLIAVGAQGLGHDPGSRIRTFRRRLDYSFRAVLEEGIDLGEIRPCRVPVVSAMIFGAFNWIGTWHNPDGKLPLDRVIDDFLSIVADGLGSDPAHWLSDGGKASTAAGRGLSVPEEASIDPADKRYMILRSAADVFAERGYEGTSLKDIAARVNLHKASLYHYMSGKSDLLVQCLETSFANLREVAEVAECADVAPLDRLAFFFRHLVAAQCSDFGRCVNLIRPEVLPEVDAQRVISFKQKLDRIVRDLLRQAMERGEMRQMHTTTAAAFLFGASNWVPHWHRPDRDPPLDVISDSFLRLFLAGLVARSSQGR